MQIYPTQFPEHRRTDPTRQAELRVYNELLNSDLDGLAVYGSKPTPNRPEVDVTLWLPNNARLSDEVKGGAYSLQGGEWMLHSVGGPPRPVDRPCRPSTRRRHRHEDGYKGNPRTCRVCVCGAAVHRHGAGLPHLGPSEPPSGTRRVGG